MQEDIERRTIAITMEASRLSARTLAHALAMSLRMLEEQHAKSQTPSGRQTVQQLMNHKVATNSIPLDGATQQFDKVAQKYGVDYAFHQTAPGKYLLFFKSGQADAITAAFGEYSTAVLAGACIQPSVLEQLKFIAEQLLEKPREFIRQHEASRASR